MIRVTACAVLIAALAACEGQAPQVKEVRPEPSKPTPAPEQEPGWGTLTVEPNRMIRMDETPTFTLTFTSERWIGHETSLLMGVPNQFSRPQDDDPDGYGYCEVASSSKNLNPSLVLGKHKSWGFDGWGWAVEIRWDGVVRKGDKITLTYGKGKGAQLGHVAFALVFRCKVRHNFPNEDHAVPDPPPIPLTGAKPVSFIVTAPTTVAAGEPFDVTIVPRDEFDNACLEFKGTVEMFVSEVTIGEPFRTADISMTEPGKNRVTGLELGAGVTRIRVKGPDGLTGHSNPVVVTEKPPAERVYWGELHIHTTYSDGLGTPETAYLYGRDVADVDFMGVTDHVEQVTDDEWRTTQEMARKYNDPGRFVTFLAQEWSGRSEFGGDHNVFHLHDDQPLYRSNEPHVHHVTDLFRQLSQGKSFTIPHVGGRTGNLDFHDPKVQRGVEIYSNHGIFESHSVFALKKGYQVGIIAASDGHDGNAGYSNWLRLSIKQHGGLTAVRARELTREAIFDAVYNRRVYSTTGERMFLDVTLNGRGMGEVFSSNETPTLRVEATGTAPLKRVDILRNDTCVKTWPADGKLSRSLTWTDEAAAPGLHYYMVRVVQEETAHQKRVTLPRQPGRSVAGSKWSTPVQGAPYGKFEIEGEPKGAIAWSTPIWVRLSK